MSAVSEANIYQLKRKKSINASRHRQGSSNIIFVDAKRLSSSSTFLNATFWPKMTNHPKHPAFVHFPITFTLLTGALDALTYLSTNPSTSGLVASAMKFASIALSPDTFPVLSYYTTILILLTSLPTIASGIAELLPVIKRDGFSSKKMQIGALHAVVNDIAVLGAAWNWWTRRGNPGFEASGVNQLVSVGLAVPATLAAAYLGAELVYGMGMGVGRGGARVKAVKKQ